MKAYLLIGILFYSLSSVANKPCESEAFRQFDFWMGEWQVFTKDGNVAGTNTITPSLNGCVLNEHYVTPKGYEGTSVNIYDRSRNVWHQTWVDNTGLLLKLEGTRKNNTMTMTGTTFDKEGKKVSQKISWKKQKNGDVHQIWESSTDKGLHWKTVFYGVYKKVKAPKK